jgi:hypothetical protein
MEEIIEEGLKEEYKPQQKPLKIIKEPTFIDWLKNIFKKK